MPRRTSNHVTRRVSAGLLWSLKAERARAELNEIGAKLGTRVVFLKAAWAEPVLYGNQGKRSGCDIDVLVDPKCFREFAAALVAIGYVRRLFPTHPVSTALAHERSFHCDGRIDIDLHRGLANAPWYSLDVAGFLRRAVPYASAAGDVVSLCPDDQVLYAAAHAANHAFCGVDSHLADTLKLVKKWPIDWRVVTDAAERGGLRVALALLVDFLAANDVVPSCCLNEQTHARRIKAIQRMVKVSRAGFARSVPFGYPWNDLLINTVVSTRLLALPSMLMTHVGLRALDHGRLLVAAAKKASGL